MWKRIRPFVISIAVALAVGALSALITNDSMQYYALLKQPPLAPPGAVFPIVWTVLFVLMGISAALVYEAAGTVKTRALGLYALQLVVNFLWPILFFVWRLRLAAFVWLLVLLGLVIAMLRAFARHSRTAARLQIPYVLWLAFAGYLNLATFLLNG